MTVATRLRKGSKSFLLVALALLAIPALAPATPVIRSFSVRAMPIPGVRGTGVLGAGAVLEGRTRITGTEYSGSPAPLIGITFFAPAGTKLHAQGFASCTASTLEQVGPQACPKHSAAGPAGFALGAVSIGRERVPERVSVQPFFAPGGGVVVFVDGKTPTLIEILAKASVEPGTPPYGLTAIAEIPLIETLPEAPDASFLEGAVRVGAARKQHGRTISYVTLPSRCPSGGWPIKEELRFLGGTQASDLSKMPCPGARS